MSALPDMSTLLTIRLNHAYFNDRDSFIDDDPLPLRLEPDLTTMKVLHHAFVRQDEHSGDWVIFGSDIQALPQKMTFLIHTDSLDMFSVTAIDGTALSTDAGIDVLAAQNLPGQWAVTQRTFKPTDAQPMAASHFARLHVTRPTDPRSPLDITFDALSIQREIIVVAAQSGIDLNAVRLSHGSLNPLDIKPHDTTVDARFDAVSLTLPDPWPLRQIRFDDDLLRLHFTRPDGTPERTVVPDPTIDALQQAGCQIRAVSYIYI